MKKKWIVPVVLGLAGLLAFSACSAGTEKQSVADSSELSWWQKTIAYEIYVRSFKDSDGDGIGDLNGVKEKLPYLQDLGVKTVWLMPIMPSPSYHGYDVSDYYSINSDYGTMDDFTALTAAAAKANIDIMIDISDPVRPGNALPFQGLGF